MMPHKDLLAEKIDNLAYYCESICMTLHSIKVSKADYDQIKEHSVHHNKYRFIENLNLLYYKNILILQNETDDNSFSTEYTMRESTQPIQNVEIITTVSE